MVGMSGPFELAQSLTALAPFRDRTLEHPSRAEHERVADVVRSQIEAGSLP
jgi:hypothetical protein